MQPERPTTSGIKQVQQKTKNEGHLKNNIFSYCSLTKKKLFLQLNERKKTKVYFSGAIC